MTKEALTQLREIHAIQGLDGCWDIDDYMLGMFNGLELALSIVENRECRYKQRPKSQLEQKPVAWGVFDDNLHDMFFAKEEAQEMVRLKGDGSTVKPLYTTPPQRTWVDLTRAQFAEILCDDRWQGRPELMLLQAQSKLKEQNNV